MTTWVFVRHGESVANAARVLSGWDDVALTPRGEEQARAVGEQLATYAVDRAISSDLCRASRTAELALERWSAATGRRAPRLERDGRLRERNLGGWQGLSYDALRDRGDTSVLVDWQGRPPGGESLQDLAWRLTAALMVLESQRHAETTLVVAHGGVIRALLGLVDGVSTAELGKATIANATPHARTLPAGRWAELYVSLEAELAD